MFELRKDPLFSRWLAVRRESMPPSAYAHPQRTEDGRECPLCAGGGDAGAVRIVQSADATLAPEGDLGRRGIGMYDMMNAVGHDEIVIESPRHDVRPEDLGEEHFQRLVSLYRSRTAAIEEDPRIRFTLLCMDSDPRAGARFSHPHARIVATPIIPMKIKNELDSAKEYYSNKERCIFCDILEEEQRTASRMILETERFAAFAPFAPKFAFEFWVMPKRHACAFKEAADEEVRELGSLLTTLLRRMRRVLGEPPFSYVIHSAPNRIPKRDRWHTIGDDYHWHMEVMPRLTRTSGLEAGSGFYTVGTSPEEAARYLREG